MIATREYVEDMHGPLLSSVRRCTTTATHKRCPKCAYWLPLNQFGKNKARQYGVKSYCVSCENDTRDQRARQVRNCRLKYEYGISIDDFEALADSLDWRCQICSTQTDELCVDHCHESGNIRSLLCKKCNSALGLLNDDPGVVESALQYLRRYK